MTVHHQAWARIVPLALTFALPLACGDASGPAPTRTQTTAATPSKSSGPAEANETNEAGEPDSDTAEPDDDDPFTGESAHVIPFADRTSMGYLLLLPPEPGGAKPAVPSRAQLHDLVQASFSDRRSDSELDLLFKLIATEPHATDIAFTGDLEPPSLDEFAREEDAQPGQDPGQKAAPEPTGDAQLEELAAKAERARAFDLLGLHIELLRVDLSEDSAVPTSVLEDPILTRSLSPEQRKSLLGRRWALLLRADYRSQHGLRGLRLHQTLVRIVAAHYEALIHDPDTLETLDLKTFTRKRLRAAAGNIADQLAIVPFPDPSDDSLLRLGTRGMRRFGTVDLELAGLPRDPVVLQRASDFLAGLALVLAREGEVDSSGFAVQVPEELEVNCALIKQSYAGHGEDPGESPRYEPPCAGSGPAFVHLVERHPEAHDPRDHVVARVVAIRALSDAPDYDHPQWAQSMLSIVFGAPPVASAPTP